MSVNNILRSNPGGYIGVGSTGNRQVTPPVKRPKIDDPQLYFVDNNEGQRFTEDGAGWRITEAGDERITEGVEVPFTGTVAATSSVTGTLTGRGALTGTVAAVSAVTATLRGTGALTGNVAAVSTVNGTPIASAAITGSVAAVSTVAGTLTGRGALTGTVAAVSTVAATLTGQGALTGAVSAVSSVTGSLTGRGALTGSVAAVSTVAGTLAGTGALTGSVAAVSTVNGTLTQLSSNDLSGSVAATSAVTGVLTGNGALAGLVAANSNVTGTLTGDAPAPVEEAPRGGGWVDPRVLGKLRKRLRDAERAEERRREDREAIKDRLRADIEHAYAALMGELPEPEADELPVEAPAIAAEVKQVARVVYDPTADLAALRAAVEALAEIRARLAEEDDDEILLMAA